MKLLKIIPPACKTIAKNCNIVYGRIRVFLPRSKVPSLVDKLFICMKCSQEKYLDKSWKYVKCAVN